MLDLKQIVDSATLAVDNDLIRMAEELKNVKGKTDRELYICRLGSALAGSLPVIDIEVALRAGGCDQNYLWPRLAFVRADANKAHATLMSGGSINFGNSALVDDMIPRGGLGRWIVAGKEWQADVPMVPVSIRPPSLLGYNILFEPVWQQSIPRIADPYLLKGVVGEYYQVVASWDVTELEIKAMRAARI